MPTLVSENDYAVSINILPAMPGKRHQRTWIRRKLRTKFARLPRRFRGYSIVAFLSNKQKLFLRMSLRVPMVITYFSLRRL